LKTRQNPDLFGSRYRERPVDEPEGSLDSQVKIAESVYSSFRRRDRIAKNHFRSRWNPALEHRSRFPS
jgi:hypothetical protein